MAEYTNLNGFKDKDGNIISAPSLKYMTLTSKGNVQIESPAGAKLNIESGDNEAHKPTGKIQLDTNHYAPEDQKKFKLSVICDKASKVQGMNIEAAGIDFETSAADAKNGWTPNQFRLRFKGNNTDDDWANLNLHASSIDLRTRTIKPGSGGGISVQIASCDSELHENKFKIETSRIVKPELGQLPSDDRYDQFYVGEGGKGIEIGTINSQFESFYTDSMRRGANTKVYAVTRSDINKNETGKYDYDTQPDDSKDIINPDQPEVRWIDIINAAAYLKKAGLIPDDGTFVQ